MLETTLARAGLLRDSRMHCDSFFFYSHIAQHPHRLGTEILKHGSNHIERSRRTQMQAVLKLLGKILASERRQRFQKMQLIRVSNESVTN